MKSMRKRSEEHTSELQSRENLVCRLLLEKKKKILAQGESTNPKETNLPSHHVSNSDQLHASLRTFGRSVFQSVKRVTLSVFFFFNDPATTEIYTLSLHDALPI